MSSPRSVWSESEADDSTPPFPLPTDPELVGGRLMPNHLSGQRIAMVCPHYYPVTCGVGDYSMRLARELIERGAEVALFTHSPAERNPECEVVDVHGGAGRTPLEVTRDFRDALLAYDPSHVIIQYTPHMLLASRFGSPAIPVLMSEMRGRSHVTVIFHELYNPWSWRPDLAISGAMQRLQFVAVVGAADRIFVTTVARKRLLEGIFRRAGRPREVELLFVGANAPPLPVRTEHDGHRIGIFSMLGRTRRFDLMIDAFTLVHQRYPDSELVLIGDLGTDSSSRYRDLKAHIAQSPAAKHIRLTGAIPLWRVAEEVAALDVYMLPDETGASTRSSTLPVALGSGIPVVATCGPETALNFFVDGENIAFADAMTATDLAAVALRVLDDPILADKLGTGGRLLYQRDLAWSAIADRLLPRSLVVAPTVDTGISV
jgi:glycosyltransferase involved in cell wall biosynthesis